METIIEYKGKIHSFKKPIHLPEKVFYDRCWFVVKNITEDNIEGLADIYIAWKYYDTEHSSAIMEKIKQCEANMISN